MSETLPELEAFRGRLAGLEHALWAWSRGKPVARFIHGSVGHEAAAFAVTRAIAADDAWWALYYRSHAWLLGLGVGLDTIASAIAGSSDSHLSHRAGPMHLLLHPAVIDCNSIVGAQLPIAVGAALAARGRGRRVVCVLGDGATSTGVFFESLNIAAVHRAPVLFVVEDNGIAMSTPYDRLSRASIAAKFNLFSIPFRTCHASDPAVVEMAIESAELARSGPAAMCVIGQRVGAHALAFESGQSLAAACSGSPAHAAAASVAYQEVLDCLEGQTTTRSERSNG